MTGFEKVFHLLKKEEKRTGSDYTATVSRVGKGVAYVQIAGAEITDTPVSMSIDAKPGDQVRVRVNGGKAWLTGNDSHPPNDSTAEVEETAKQIKDVSKQIETITGQLKTFLPRNMGVKRAEVYNDNVALQAKDNRITFALPDDLKTPLGVRIDMAWPMSTWTGAVVAISKDGTTIDGAGYVDVYSGSAQTFRLVLSLLYI